MENISLKPKVTLKRKGEGADVATFTKMKVQLNWKLQRNADGTLGPDFDLMAFYKAKDGRVGGICSELYNNNSADMGYIDRFPFMELDKDDKADNSSNEGDEASELLKVAKLDDFEEVYICVINYDDAVENIPEVFGKYNGFVSVQSDGGDNFEVPLNSTESGHVAVICKIISHNGKPRLINVNDTFTLGKFAKAIPGTSLILN
jgi:uncharacterized protein involved in tellurium resistance